MNQDELTAEAIGGANYMLTEGATDRAKDVANRIGRDMDGSGLNIAEAGFVLAWLLSTLLTSSWPKEQKVLMMTAIGNLALFMHDNPATNAPTPTSERPN